MILLSGSVIFGGRNTADINMVVTYRCDEVVHCPYVWCSTPSIWCTYTLMLCLYVFM